MGSSARFVDEDTHLDFSKVVATDGQVGYDVAGLLNKTGNVMIDPGFVNTASCESQITYIDGEQGVLRYRGYPIEQLAKQSTFLETAYVVLYGNCQARPNWTASRSVFVALPSSTSGCVTSSDASPSVPPDACAGCRHHGPVDLLTEILRH